jgi:hypothetical protein
VNDRLSFVELLVLFIRKPVAERESGIQLATQLLQTYQRLAGLPRFRPYQGPTPFFLFPITDDQWFDQLMQGIKMKIPENAGLQGALRSPSPWQSLRPFPSPGRKYSGNYNLCISKDY